MFALNYACSLQAAEESGTSVLEVSVSELTVSAPVPEAKALLQVGEGSSALLLEAEAPLSLSQLRTRKRWCQNFCSGRDGVVRHEPEDNDGGYLWRNPPKGQQTNTASPAVVGEGTNPQAAVA